MFSKVTIIHLIYLYSWQYNLDPKVALAVARTESRLNPRVVSSTNDVGVFQLHRDSFPQYSLEELQDPRKNIELGIKYLSEMKKKCVHRNKLDWLICFNVGIKGAKKIKYPRKFIYVVKVNNALYN